MVHLGPLSYMEINGQDVTDQVQTTESWTLDHEVHAFARTESRPGEPTADGERWMERQTTGKVMVVCTCGYSSGLIDHTELTSTVASLAEQHSAPAVAPKSGRSDGKDAGQNDLI
ncbi:hypothetical protein ACFYRN_09945 [Streptomyces sp. NPDC005227]|uniref:hypothetical protein n=1 Tax=Streptomyces sp. NPDC005227 TaxID=3364707 RepID=UPI003688F0F6